MKRGRQQGFRFNFHDGQLAAWNSEKRIVLILAGVRAGKTSFGPIWLYREMARRGPGDYLIAAPSYPILDKAAIPEVEQLFRTRLGIGSIRRGPLRFDFSVRGCKQLWGKVPERPPRILFGHADDPESLAAMQVKAAWLDEAGQTRFKLDSWEEVRRRLSIDLGRCLLTTTVYNLGWIKQKLYDPWERAQRRHPSIDVIQFDSLANPAFSREEYDRAMGDMPRWRFNMFYKGIFERPAGLIYDKFDTAAHVVKRMPLPDSWERFVGLDFGGLNTAGLFFAKEPNGPYYAYREYWPRTGRTAKEHAAEILKGEPRRPTCVGGSRSEDQWRNEFAAAGLPIQEPPVSDVEVGINRVYGLIARNELRVFSDLEHTLDQLSSYSREVDAVGQPTEKIADKETFHILDALRYIGAWLGRDRQPWKMERI